MQLMTVVSVRLKELSKEGELGRKRITRYTRWLTVPLAALQAYGFMALFTNSSATSAGAIIPNPTVTETLTVILTLTAGTIVAMWLGELITEYGVGNGVSLIIFTGIIAQLPGALFSYGSEGGAATSSTSSRWPLIALVATAGIIYVQQAQRKVPMQSAQRVLNPRTGMASAGGRRNFLPLRVNTAGRHPDHLRDLDHGLPDHLRQLLRIGERLAQQPPPAGSGSTGSRTAAPCLLDLLYNGIEFVLILGFTYFYTAVVFDPNDVADNLKKSSTLHPRHQARAPDRRVPGHGSWAGSPWPARSSWPASPWCCRSPPAS